MQAEMQATGHGKLEEDGGKRLINFYQSSQH
jgi:hypothetical protein